MDRQLSNKAKTRASPKIHLLLLLPPLLVDQFWLHFFHFSEMRSGHTDARRKVLAELARFIHSRQR